MPLLIQRNKFDENAPGKIVPTTTSKRSYPAFHPDALPPANISQRKQKVELTNFTFTFIILVI